VPCPCLVAPGLGALVRTTLAPARISMWRASVGRIGVLLRPRDGKAVIGGDPSARLIEAGLLYGRLSTLQEQRGRQREAAASMSRAVALLKDAGHPDPTERHIREMVVRQGAAAPRR